MNNKVKDIDIKKNIKNMKNCGVKSELWLGQ